MTHRHFKDKDALSHVIEARIKGRTISDESHGIETPHQAVGIYAAQETAVVYLLLWILLQAMMIPYRQIYIIFTIFFLGWLIWNIGKSAYLGWLKLTRLNKLIQEERYEIEHHRSQEKQELEALYKAKGFSGKLLDEVINVLMADDNRLLQIMLEEEMGLTLGTFEHPLKYAVSAFLGVIISSCFFAVFMYFLPNIGVYISSALIFFSSIFIITKKAKMEMLPLFIWSISILGLSSAFVYFSAQIVKLYFLNV